EPAPAFGSFFTETERNSAAIGKPAFRPERKRPRKKAERIATTGAEHEVWKAGDKAHHHKWGTGTVVKVQGTGDATALDVACPASTGIKRLMAKYAPITKQYRGVGMEKQEPKKRIETLVHKLHKYAHEYYVLDVPTVPDAEYDKL